MPSFTIDKEMFVSAIRRFAGLKKGWEFYPCRITASSFEPPESITIEMESEPLEPPQEKGFSDREGMVYPQLFELTETEVAHALSKEINNFLQHIKYDGNRIRLENLPKFLTFPVRIRLEFVPMGSTVDSHPDTFGGL